MSIEAAAGTETQVHGGRLVARRLAALGVTRLFTLSGGHLFSIYDGCLLYTSPSPRDRS